jgi:hypothetical protein
MTVKAPKTLIEVALPLDDINAAAAREKSIGHGHPSTLHLGWAPRPSHRWTWRRPPSDPAWWYLPAIRRCWRRTARR